MNHWLVKSEPETYSFKDLEEEQNTIWDGIRNYQARNFLKEMEKGDKILFYHSGKERSVVGTAEVSKASFPDPDDDTDTWLAVEIKPLKSFSTPVTLQQIKETEALKDILLIKQSRLSVMSLTEEEYKLILEIGQKTTA